MCVADKIKVRAPSNLYVIYFDIGGRVGSAAERLVFADVFLFFFLSILSLSSFLPSSPFPDTERSY